ncbi:unnamed protein product [Prunus brigantina]
MSYVVCFTTIICWSSSSILILDYLLYLYNIFCSTKTSVFIFLMTLFILTTTVI